jgi:hypothetical protein
MNAFYTESKEAKEVKKVNRRGYRLKYKKRTKDSNKRVIFRVACG